MPELAIVIYILVISLISMLVTIHDKNAARAHARRIPERTLLLLGALGGAGVMLVTMKTIRHKTRKAKFMIPLPIFLVIHIALLVLWIAR